MTHWLAVFVGGLLGSSHCIGMCGGFAIGIGASAEKIGPATVRQLIYSAGRMLTYCFLGAVGGFAGLYLQRFRTPLLTVQQVFSVVAGVLMVIVALSILIPRRATAANASGGCVTASLLGPFMRLPGHVGVFLAGIATGFLPCGLVYGFLAQAAATSSIHYGALTMLAFGLGTVPLMVATGCGGQFMTHHTRMRVYRVAACVVLIMGAVTVRRGFASRSDRCCDCETSASATTTAAPSA